MAKIKKKGTSGNAKNYITRSQAVRKLQISLPDFRRLCIFKGIYPREPRSKKRASKSSTPSTTFYYTKDIQYLLHEPLLAKFRDQKALAKKISKALGRNEVSDASRLERNLTPKMKLDHIIKERYPTFVDALRDLDDALSMLFLFANLPSTTEVPPGMIAKCQRLTMEFEHYLIRTHSLRKSFLSIKGIYYQATIQAQDILYLVPYRFVQRTAGDVDYRIMATFVEFYTTLLGFVNYRLYTGIGLVYPPRFNLRSEEQGAELAAFQLEHKDDGVEETEQQQLPEAAANESAQAEVDKLLALPPEDEPVTSQTVQADEEQDAENGTTTALDQFESVDPSADSLLQPSRTADVETAAKLFEPFTFYLSRETPRHPLEFILKAFGCRRVGWPSLDGEAGSYCNEDDPRITHQIVDRPDLPLPSPPPEDDDEPMLDDGVDDSAAIRKANERVPGRTYVQPQWVWDCINAGQLLRPDLYAPGATLPPHLSPWVKAKPGEYDPTKPLTEQQTEAEAAAADDSSDEDEDEDEEADDDGDIDEGSDGEEADGVGDDGEAEVPGATLQGQDVAPGEGMDVDVGGSDHESESDAVNGADDDDFGGFDDDEEEDDAAREAREHQAELEAEALGKAVEQKDPKEKKKAAKAQAQSKRTHAERQAEEAKERAKMMMSNRKRKMYEKMVYSNAEKEAQSAQLRSKRQKYEKEQGKKQKAKQ